MKKTVSGIMLMVLLVSTQPLVFAAKFNLGDTVEVFNTGASGLLVRDAPAGNIIGKKYDGYRGMILAGPQSAPIGGVVYTWWKVRWGDDALEGWSAEGYPGGLDYLKKVYVSPSTKFSIGDFVKVYNTGGYGMVVRTDPPALSYKDNEVDGTVGKVESGPFYGAAEGKSGFYHFWKVNYGSVVGWSAEDWLTKTTPSDLTIEDIWIEPASINPGTTVTIYTRIKNIGTSAAISDQGLWIKSYFDGGLSYQEGIEGLGAGYAYTFQWSYTWPSDTNWHTVEVRVDPANYIIESNENNNVRSESFQATAPPPPNQPPTLYNGYVSPSSGDTSTTFSYYVTYSDPEGDVPTLKYVYIDGSPYTMVKISGDYVSGAVFKYSTTLSAVSHNYYFYFKDRVVDGYTVRLPISDTYPGPNVSLPPTADFSITASPTSLTIQQGSSGTSTITITSINGFNQSVQLSVSGAPSGVTATLSPQQVTPPAGGSTTSTLTVSVGTPATPGSYTLTVNGTSGALTHSKYISLEITSAPPPPNPPTLVSPGSSSSPGEEIYTLTPALTWNSVPGADQYGLYIRDMDSNELVFDSQVRGITITGTSYTLPSGILQWGKHYRWNMNSHNEAGWGEFSPPLYFYTAQLDLLSKIIQQEMQEKVTVTVGGKEYYIVTIKRYISPSTWEPSDYTFLDHAPDVRKVYTNTDFIPILDRQLAKKIGIIDRANNLLKRIGKPDSIQTQIEAINTVFEADEDLSMAELTAQWTESIIFTTMDLCIFVELEQPLSIATEISSFLWGQLERYADPQQFMIEGGRALLVFAKRDYEEAKRIAEENAEGIYDYDVAKNYLNTFYNAHFKTLYGVDAVLPRGRITESALWEIAGWMPDYVIHLGPMLTSHLPIPILKELIGTVKAAIIERQAIENMDEFREFINNVNEIPNMVAQLLEDESFPVDYTQALAYKSITMLARWGIIGVDEINVNIACPAELRVYDSNGNVAGTVEGEIRMEIPNSFYYNSTVTIFLPNDTYTIEVMGTGTGTYRLEALYVEDKGITSFVAIDLPTPSNMTHQYTIDWDALSLGEEGVNVQVDSDGDGVFEYTFASDSELNRHEYVIATTKYDIGITGITSSKSVIGQGHNLPINITIMNYGAYTETFNVTIYANTTLIALQTATLTSGNSTTITFTWNTTGFAKGKYTISATADTLQGEAYTKDNSLTDGWVIVTWLGDLDGDFRVDENDLWHFCGAFIDYYKIHVLDPLCDFDKDNDIDEDDLWTFCGAFIDYWKTH